MRWLVAGVIGLCACASIKMPNKYKGDTPLRLTVSRSYCKLYIFKGMKGRGVDWADGPPCMDPGSTDLKIKEGTYHLNIHGNGWFAVGYDLDIDGPTEIVIGGTSTKKKKGVKRIKLDVQEEAVEAPAAETSGGGATEISEDPYCVQVRETPRPRLGAKCDFDRDCGAESQCIEFECRMALPAGCYGPDPKDCSTLRSDGTYCTN